MCTFTRPSVPFVSLLHSLKARRMLRMCVCGIPEKLWVCHISKSSEHREPSVRLPPHFESPPARQPGRQTRSPRLVWANPHETKEEKKKTKAPALTCISFSPYLDGFLLPWLFLRSFFSSPWHFSRLSPLLLCSTWYFLRAACVEGGAECTVNHWCTWRSRRTAGSRCSCDLTTRRDGLQWHRNSHWTIFLRVKKKKYILLSKTFVSLKANLWPRNKLQRQIKSLLRDHPLLIRSEERCGFYITVNTSSKKNTQIH